jgi:hypothetical protein
MNFRSRFHGFLLTVVTVSLFTPQLHSQDRISVRNDMYRYGVRQVGGSQLFVIDGLAPTLPDEVGIPVRTVRIPVDERSPFDLRLEGVSTTEPVAASPFVRYAVTMAKDSTLRSELLAADVPREYAGGATAAIRSKRFTRDRGKLELVLELPLLEWDAAANSVRWIEEYVFERVVPQNILSMLPAVSEDLPPYASQRFTTRSRNVDTSRTWIDFGNPMLRFFVRQDGLYKVTADWMRNSGFNPASIDPSRVELFRKGVAVPVYLHGMDDGRFDDGDYILFYGTKNYDELGHRRVPAHVDDPYPQYMSIFTDSTAYWFNFNSPSTSRITQSNLDAQGLTDTLDWAYKNVHFEQDNVLWSYASSIVRAQLPDWTSEDSWYIWFTGGTPTLFSVDNLASAYPARAYAKVAHWFGDANYSPNHAVTMVLNKRVTIDSVAFNVDEQALLSAEFPATLLFNGVDTLQLFGRNLQPAGSTSTIVDWYDLEYPRHLVANDRHFIFATDTVMQLRPSLLKVTSPRDMNHYMVRMGESGSVLLNLHGKQSGSAATYVYADSLFAGSTYIFCPSDSTMEPPKGELRVVEELVKADNAASYLVVTAESLLGASREYADFIERSYGLATRVVTIEDIYDHYSYGMFQPEAIKLLTFEAWHTWKTDSLRFLFLIGDANVNYKFSTGPYSSNIVPSYGTPVSDVWFVCFDERQHEPSFPVGRLSARTEEEIHEYRKKHEAYLVQPFDLWNKSSLLFSGGDLNLGNTELLKFKAINQVVVDNVVQPRSFSGQATHFYKTLDPQSDFGPYTPDFVKSRIQDGGVFISYVGHSGTATWDNSIAVASDLNNRDGRGSLVTDFGCSTGRFAEPDIISFSEAAVVGREGQFIGYIGNASAGFESTTSTLPYLYYSALIRDRAPSIGAAHINSKHLLQQLYGKNIINTISTLTNVLIGDPIVKAALPEKPNFVAKDQWMKVEEDILTDQMDSLHCIVVIGNYGMHIEDSLDVHLEQQFPGQQTLLHHTRIGVPDIYDTLRLSVPLARKSGRGLLRVILDRDGLIDEIYENDNTASLQYDVFSTFMKVVDERLEHTSGGRTPIRILNPALSPGQISNMLVEFAQTTDFSSPVQANAAYGKTMTETAFQPLSGEAPTFWRARLEGGSGEYIGPYKRHPALDGDFIQADSADFDRSELTDVRIIDDAVTTMSGDLLIQAESAGFPTKYCAIRLNGVNIVKTTFFRGYSIAVFDSLSMKLKRFAQFDSWGNGAHRDSIRIWIEGVQTGEIVVVTTADEPQTGSNVFAAAMRSIGSVMIDSVRRYNRCSWAMIGHKGAAAGSVPEAFNPRGELVSTQQLFPVLPDTGYVRSPLIGPSAAWDELRLQRSSVAETDITVSVIGFDTTGTEQLLLDGGNVETLDLSGIDAGLYPHIRIQAALVPESATPPELKAWSLAYVQLAELAINYQSVSVLQDSVIQGTPIGVSIGILNAGEAAATDIPVLVEAIGSDNIPRPAAAFTVPRLAERSWFDSTISVATDMYTGPYQLRVVVDRDNIISEQYEDNNSYITSFYVKADTTRPHMDIAFDGYLPLDGDYIRYNPEVVLTLRTPPPYPISEKEKFRVSIDGDALSLDSLSASFTPSTRETPAVLRFQPNLADGEYYFGFNATDGNDQKVYEEDLEIRVRVSSQSRIAEMYNYPNPFSGETQFTFLLTGAGVPEEIQVKVYTVAGRLIRTMTYPPTAVRIGYNALKWDGRDEDGDAIANGVYFYKLISRFSDTTVEEVGRMSVLK